MDEIAWEKVCMERGPKPQEPQLFRFGRESAEGGLGEEEGLRQVGGNLENEEMMMVVVVMMTVVEPMITMI